MDRTRQAFALITVDRKGLILVPLVSALVAFIIVLGVGVSFLLLNDNQSYRPGLREGMQWSGAIFMVLGPLIATGAAVMASSFGLALGLGLSRREYLRAAMSFYLIQATVSAVFITAVRQLELATDGWGLSVRFFDVIYLGEGEWWQFFIQTLLVILTAALLFAVVSVCLKRWGRTAGYTLSLIVLAVAAVIVVLAATTSGFWQGLATTPWAAWMAILFGVTIAMAGTLVAVSMRFEVR